MMSNWHRHWASWKKHWAIIKRMKQLKPFFLIVFFIFFNVSFFVYNSASHEKKLMQQQLDAVKQLWPRAKTNLTGVAWELDWRDWE